MRGHVVAAPQNDVNISVRTYPIREGGPSLRTSYRRCLLLYEHGRTHGISNMMPRDHDVQHAALREAEVKDRFWA